MAQRENARRMPEAHLVVVYNALASKEVTWRLPYACDKFIAAGVVAP
jgi:hypothetical protein